MGLLAFLVADIEDLFHVDTLRSAGDERKAYLSFLVSCGYTPALVEKIILGEAKPKDVLEASERLKGADMAAVAPEIVKPVKKVARGAVKKESDVGPPVGRRYPNDEARIRRYRDNRAGSRSA